MSPVVSFLFLATPMAGLVTVLRATRKPPPPRAPIEKLMTLELAPPAPQAEDETASTSEAWRAAIGGMIDEEDHSSALAEHYRRKPN